ncbi:MAG: BrnA antitoxin family protein [bacterium]|nr:BrnA antitoxin family protein [bacterium]
MSGYRKALDPTEIARVEDGAIDFGDIAELDDAFWREAELVEPDRTEQITLRVKRSVLDHFRAPGRGYQTRINRVLESYVRAQREAG